MFCVDPDNPRARALAEKLEEHLDFELVDPNLCLVVGGDGWMLTCIRDKGPDHVFVGLNAGTLGFLLNDVEDAANVAAAIHEGRYTHWNFPRLSVTCSTLNGDNVRSTAVNDIYAERMTGKTAHLRLTIDTEPIVDRMVADGVVVATALGSTAYSFSAGGPACHPLVPAVHVTPICPHMPRIPPLTLPENAEVVVDVRDPELRPVRAVADGTDCGQIKRMVIAPSAKPVKLAFLEGHMFTRTLIRKLLRS